MTTPEASKLADELEQFIAITSSSTTGVDLMKRAVVALRCQPGKPDREEVARAMHEYNEKRFLCSPTPWNKAGNYARGQWLDLADIALTLTPSHEAPAQRTLTKDESARIHQALINSGSSIEAPAQEPVACRWRPLNGGNWIYDPNELWRDQHRNEIELQLLYAAPASHDATREALILARTWIDPNGESVGYSSEVLATIDAALAPIREDRVQASSGRIKGADGIVDEAACLIWAELCPGLVMGDEDRRHYENAARAVLALPAEDHDKPHETCAVCMGSGFSNHPDSGETCNMCGGYGVVFDSCVVPPPDGPKP